MKRLLLMLFMFSIFLSDPNIGHAFFEDKVDDIKIEVESLNRYFPESEEKGEANEIAVWESELNINFDINPERDLSFEWDFGLKNVSISDNSSSIDLPANLVARYMRLGAEIPAPLVDDERVRLGAAVIPSYYTDSFEDSFKDFESSAFRWQSEYWLDYNVSEKWRFRVGLLYRPDFADQRVLPIVEMDYKFNDRWDFRLTSDDIGFYYQATDKLQLFTEHRYVLDEYEITANGQDGRVLRHKQNTTGIGAKYAINENSFAKVSVGGAYNRNFRFVDGEDEPKAVLKESMYATFEFVWNF